jgi:hypothetical protein
VSDPGLNPKAARRQAIYRAAYLYSLQEGMPLRLLADLFLKVETQSNKYEALRDKMLVMAEMELPFRHYTYRIEQEYLSSFGEMFLQVIFGKEMPHSLSCRSLCELMMLSTRERTEEKELKLLLTIETQEPDSATPIACRYELKGYPERPDVSSAINGSEVRYPRRGCHYADRPDPNAKKPEIRPSSTLYESFWTAYMTSLVDQLLSYSYNTSHMQQVTDHYSGSGFTAHELSRERVNTHVKLLPHAEAIERNRLFTHWKIVEYVNPLNSR